MTSTAPAARTYSVSGHQAVLSAGIAIDDMDYLVQVAQSEGVPRAKLVKRIIREWRQQHEEHLSVGLSTDGQPLYNVPSLDENGQPVTLLVDQYGAAVPDGHVVVDVVELRHALLETATVVPAEFFDSLMADDDPVPALHGGLENDDDALTAQVVAAQAIETFYGGQLAPVPDGVMMLSDAELAALDSGDN